MRLIVIGLTLALAASAPLAATAQAPVSTQPLARGEVLLELNANGSVTTRADSAVLTIRAIGEGANVQEASEAVQREAARLAGIARANAGANASVEIGAAQSIPIYDAAMAPDMNMAMPADMNATMTMDANAMETDLGSRMQAVAMVSVRVRDLSRLGPLQAVLTQAGASLAGEPVYSLADPAAAQREARTRALVAARSSAEAYAGALDMRVVRVLRVTERLGIDMFTMMMNEQRLRRQFEENHSPDVETSVSLGVDFALAPR